MTGVTFKAQNSLIEVNRRWLLAALAVMVLGIAAHANGLGGEFVFDDRPFLGDNPQPNENHSLACRPAHRIEADDWKACANLVLLLNESGQADQAAMYMKCAASIDGDTE